MSQSHSVLLFQLSMYSFNEVMNELGRTTPKPTTANTGPSANQQTLKVFKLSSNRPTGGQSTRAAPPQTPGRGQPGARKSQNTAADQCRAAPRRRAPPMGAAGRKEKQCGPQAAGFESNVRTGAGRRPSGAGQSAAAARGPRTLGQRPRPAPLFVVSAAAGAGPGHSPGGRRAAGGPEAAGGRASGRRARAESGRPPAAAEPESRGGRSHVGEHGRAAAPGHDQPVRAGRGVRGRPGEAAAAGGPLAVRDRPEHVFPRNQHSQRPPPPPDADVHPQQHTCHAAQLSGCTGHVLQASRLGGLAERQRPHDGRGLLPPCKLQPLLGLVPPRPPGRVDPTLLAHGPQLPPPAPPAAHVAPRSTAGGLPAESRGRHGWPEMTLDAARRWAGAGGQPRVAETQEGQGGGSWGGRGFPEDRTGRFYKKNCCGGAGLVNFLSHLGPSGVSLQASFFSF